MLTLILSLGRAFMKVTGPLNLSGIIAGGLISLVTAMNGLASRLSR